MILHVPRQPAEGSLEFASRNLTLKGAQRLKVIGVVPTGGIIAGREGELGRFVFQAWWPLLLPEGRRDESKDHEQATAPRAWPPRTASRAKIIASIRRQ